MRIGSNYGYGFDPYKDYTDALKRSVSITESQRDEGHAAAGHMNSSRAALSAVQKENNSISSDVELNDKKAEEVSANIKALDIDDIIGGDDTESKDIAHLNDVNDAASRLKGIKEFDMIGRESDINSLDETVGISGIQKDSLLQQYQYFVRNVM